MKQTNIAAIGVGLYACFAAFALQAQTKLEGYVFEQHNRGFLNQAKIVILDLASMAVKGEANTDAEGRFSALLQPGRYRVSARKDLFFDRTDTIEVNTAPVYLKMEMKRRPGYLFDATLAETRSGPDQIVDGITKARIEIYNRTARKPELIILDNPQAFFQFTFEQGNHYTIMIRKAGYIAKRIEAYVNVAGCIICIDGVKELTPGVTENLTAGNEMGSLLANIELEKAKVDKKIVLRNIYYDYDKWDIRPDAAKELDKVVNLMRDNPALSIELGSHTDARGALAYNDELSQKRAEAAVAYIVSEGDVAPERITAKGYGETQLANRCRDGADCSEAEHQWNRRTELRITGVNAAKLEASQWLSLADIVDEEDRRAEAQKLRKQKKMQEKKMHMPAAEAVKVDEDALVMPEAPPPAAATAPPPASVAAPPAVRRTDTPSSGKAAPLPAEYSGYKIEVLQSEGPLPPDDALFYLYENLFFSADRKGRYYYYVGQYADANSARAFLKNAVRRHYPKAFVVQFVKGTKKTVRG